MNLKMAPVAFGLWIMGAWLLHLSLAITLGLAGTVCVLVMLREVWWSEKAYRSIERERNEQLAREREFCRARQRERGD